MPGIFDDLSQIAVPLDEDGVPIPPDGVSRSSDAVSSISKPVSRKEDTEHYIYGTIGAGKGTGVRSSPKEYFRTHKGESYLNVNVPWWAIEKAAVCRGLPLYLAILRQVRVLNGWEIHLAPSWDLRKLGYNKNSSGRALQALVDAGLVEVIRRDNGGTKVRLVPPPPEDPGRPDRA